MKFLVTIKNHDLTDIPVAISVIKEFTLDTSKDEMKQLVKRAKKLFREAGDGNDEHCSTAVAVNKTTPWTTSEFDNYLTEFEKENLG